MYEVGNLKNLLDLASEMSYKWTDSNGTETVITYTVTGEESVEGVICWTVEGSIVSDGEENTFTVWVSKEDGTAKKVKIEEMELTGGMAEQFWGGVRVAVMFPFVVGSTWHVWEIPHIVDPAYGTVPW